MLPWETRIRLEGRLETLERAVTALFGASQKPSDYTRLALAIDQMSSDETREAERQVMRLAREDAELQRLVDASWAAKHRAAKVVFARAKLLGLPQASVLDTACALAAERPCCDLMVRNPLLLVQLCLLGAFGIFIALTARALPAMVAVFSALLFTVIAYFFSRVRVIVTNRRLVIGRRVVPLERIECVEFHRVMTRSFRQYRAVVHLHDWRELEARLPWVPDALIAALKSEGVRTRQHCWPWS